MKPFDIEAAKAGVKVQTRSGKPVTILTFEKKGVYPIVAIVHSTGPNDPVVSYTVDGLEIQGQEYENDLVMAPVVTYHVSYTRTFLTLEAAESYAAQFQVRPEIKRVAE